MNEKSRPWFRIEMKAEVEDAPASADVYIYDEIGESWWGGVSPKALIDEIQALEVDDLNVYVNSPGGAAWDGIAIMNALRRHKAKVHVTVDALAASAASMIAMAGDRITMNRGAQLMIHDASGFAMGNAQTMDETAQVLNKLSDSYADAYAARAGGSREHWRELMQAETWYTAEEAVEAGLADDWVDAEPEATAAFDLSRFKFRGRAMAPAPVLARIDLSANRSGESSAEADVQKEGLVAYLDDVIEALGMDEGTTEEETITEINRLVDLATTPVEPESKLPAGVQAVDANVFAQLQADAAAGREALEAQAEARREGIVKAAMADGRITAASKATWLSALEKDEEGAKALIESFPKNTIPVAEIGHSDDIQTAEDALLDRFNGKTQEV
ncbi:head maturation protease, ClpP-related [Gulosibacter molinativorax]|uniref:ATP-dependent Clp protease proteolytic subunit n=1 Tax=Gulosibacter molinativorax TaxID=256821 RepID=A0ABT7CEP7_9MICO|nr:head maturation protease, ClpP-related [Gulosibacter molinativorax]MDJ1372781.1 peptidase [Gulosibacter molinativorax]QUY60889.1 ATP-dependent Clp protease proteolytic subunit [Gulosibacter molinativorax]